MSRFHKNKYIVESDDSNLISEDEDESTSQSTSPSLLESRKHTSFTAPRTDNDISENTELEEESHVPSSGHSSPQTPNNLSISSFMTPQARRAEVISSDTEDEESEATDNSTNPSINDKNTSPPETDDEAYDKDTSNDDESCVPSEELNTMSSVSSSRVQSPPLKFVAPLARSSLRPVPASLVERSLATSSNLSLKPSAPSARLLPVPKSMLKKPEIVVEPEVVVVESDDDDVIIEDSIEERGPKPITSATPKTYVEESDASSSGVSLSSSANSIDNSSSSKRLALIQNQIRAQMNSNKSTGSNTSTESQSEYKHLCRQLEEKRFAYRALERALKNCNTLKLKDGGLQLRQNVERCRFELQNLEKRVKDMAESEGVEVPKNSSSVKQDIAFSIKDQNIALLGAKALETRRVEQALTMDALVSLHSSLANAPAADAKEAAPNGLLVSLMPHQQQALAWMLHREKQNPSGGILADDMGLGKTLTMIALVMRCNELENADKPKWQSGLSGPAHPGKTLVVCPASLIGQWEGQVKQHVKKGQLITMTHHGGSRDGRGRRLTSAGIVITTYGVVSQENKCKGALFRVAWERVILDEAHQIRNHKTQAAIACCELNSKYRWCLTGTPVHNKELDIYSLLKFLRCEPFCDLNVWKRWVDNKSPAASERLNTVMKSIMLRRTKENLKKEGALKDLSNKEIHEVRLDLDPSERKVYEQVLNFSKTLFSQYLQQRAEKEAMGGLMSSNIQKLQTRLSKVADVKTHDILVLLLRLRQICSLPCLIHAMLEDDAAVADGFEKEDPIVEDLFKHVRRLTIGAPAPESDDEDDPKLDNILVTSNHVFDEKRQSSKIKIAMTTLMEVLNQTKDKVVVVSQWANFLRHFETHLKKASIRSVTLDGSVLVKNRGALVDDFNNAASNVRVFLLSLTAGGVGLNLIGGNHLIIMEPHWNPQLEAQACDRVYRVGQKKPVHIYKVICKDTIEERIENLQMRKLALADSVLTGQHKKELNKLSMQDLKSLFDIK